MCLIQAFLVICPVNSIPSINADSIDGYHWSDCEDLHVVDVETLYLGLQPHAVGPHHAHQPAKVVPGVVGALQLPHEERLPRLQPRHLVFHLEVLVGVTRVPHLEVVVVHLEVAAAHHRVEPVPHQEVDEHDVGLCSDAVGLAALIDGAQGSQVLGGPVSDHPLPGGVVLGAAVAVGVADGAVVVPGLVVVALSVELEPPSHVPHPLSVGLELLSPVDVPQILLERVAAASYDQVDQVGPSYDSQHGSQLQLFLQKQHHCHCHSPQQHQGRNQRLAVARFALGPQLVQVLPVVLEGVLGLQGELVVLKLGWRGVLLLGVIGIGVRLDGRRSVGDALGLARVGVGWWRLAVGLLLGEVLVGGVVHEVLT